MTTRNYIATATASMKVGLQKEKKCQGSSGVIRLSMRSIGIQWISGPLVHSATGNKNRKKHIPHGVDSPKTRYGYYEILKIKMNCFYFLFC